MCCSQSRGSPSNPSRQDGGRSWHTIRRSWGGAEGRSTPQCCGAPPLARAPGDIGDRGGPGGAPGQAERFGSADAPPMGIGLHSEQQMSRRQMQPCRRAPGRISPSPRAQVSARRLAGAQSPASPGWRRRATAVQLCRGRAPLRLAHRRVSANKEGSVEPGCGQQPPPTPRHGPWHQEPWSALSPLVLGSCHHSAKKPSS